MTRMKGVMLVEVLVALLVVGIALPAIIAQISAQAEATADLRDRSYAQWVAQNQLELIRLSYALGGELFTGEMSGEVEMAARSWHWQAYSEPTEMKDMWRQTVEVGIEPDEVLYAAVTFAKQRPEPIRLAPGPQQ